MMNIRHSYTQTRLYAALGILLGLLFPLVAMWMETSLQGLPFTLQTALEVQRTTPLLWMIDTAPFFLGLLSTLAGLRQDRLNAVREHLEEEIEQRTREVNEAYQTQMILNSLMSLSLEDRPLEDILEQTLTILSAATDLTTEFKGAILLSDAKRENLLLKAWRNLEPPLVTLCERVPYGQCLCGRAAVSGKIEFADHIDERHDIHYEGMEPHGHYAVPLVFQGEVLGVLTLYVEEGHQQHPRETMLLEAVATTLATIVHQHEVDEQTQLQAVMLESVANAVLVTDTEDRIVWVNPAFSRLTGYSLEEVLDRPFTALRSGEHSPAFYREIRERVLAGETWQGEVTERRKDGSLFVSEQTVAPVRNKRGEVSHLVYVMKDITERKRAEKEIRRQKQYFEALFQHSPVAIVTLDREERIDNCNPTFEKLFGYKKEEIIGKDIDSLIVPGNERTRAREYTQQSLGGSVVHSITRRRRKDGALVDVELFGVPVLVDGERLGALALYHDITSLIEAQRQAEAAAQAKAEFLANMSHEIRTPLNAVIGMTSLLLDTPLTDEQREYAETIRNSGDALLSIINDILDFSKIEAGKMVLEKQPFYLTHCVETALDLLAGKAAEKGLDLAYLIQEGTPNRLIGDVTRLRQILVNLLSNAVKFTEQGEVVVSVSSRRIKDNLHELHFAVSDTGIGIPKERMDRLFKAFSQVDSSTTRKYGGTGLGLSISKRLAELMGGTMWAESEGPGKGSTFHFTIRAEATPATTRFYPMEAQPELSGRRVLIVDDNKTNRTILARQTEKWGMVPQVAKSGEEALRILKEKTDLDLAILDMQMPGMDGLTLAREIQNLPRGKRLPLVMLTSLGRRTEDESDLFAAFLTKPIKPSQLYDTLIDIFAHRPRRVRERKDSEFDREMGKRHPLRILLAEDNVVNQKVALALLQRLGYRADVVANGLEVLDALQRQVYDVILLDMQMPEMDGLEAAQRIHETIPEERRPRLVAMTANALEGDRERYLASGMDDYVSKPVRVEELKRALAETTPLPIKGTGHLSPSEVS
ncbi:MAG: PAS domain S-box protein [Anaerolineae bacterium]|nr:MAG: PAS domain S-box protein [Anaerolineae bacterium]